MKKLLIGLMIVGGLAAGGVALAKGRKRRIFGMQPDDGAGFTFGFEGFGSENVKLGSIVDLSDNGLQSLELRKGDILVIRVDAAPWLYDMAEGNDLRPVSEVVEMLLEEWLRPINAEGVAIIAVPSIQAWLPSLGSLPGADGRTSVLRRAATMFDEWMRGVYTTTPEFDAVFRGWVDVASMKAEDGSIDAKYVDASTGQLNAQGQTMYDSLVWEAVRQMIAAGY